MVRGCCIISLLVFLNPELSPAEEKGEIEKFEGQLLDTTQKVPHDRHHDAAFDTDDWGFYEFCAKAFTKIFFVTDDEIEDFYCGIWPGFNDYPYCPTELDEKTFTAFQASGYRGSRSYRSGVYNDALAGLKGRTYRLETTGGLFRRGPQLDGYHLGFRGAFAGLFEVSLETSGLREEVAWGTDHLQLTNLFLEYNRLRYSSFIFRWGLGWKFIRGDKDFSGFAPSLGAEIHPFYPVSLYYHFSEIRMGGAFVFEHQLRLNYHHNRYFVHIGYLLFKADNEGIPGLLVGIGAGW